MNSNFPWKEFTPAQRQAYQAASEIYLAYLETRNESRSFKGGMHWKKIRGREYLYRYRDRYGHGESLGARSEITENLFTSFSQERAAAVARVRRQRRQLEEQSRFCRAARFPRVPNPAAKILRRLEQYPDLGSLLVIGAMSIFAYAGAAGVFLDPSEANILLATSRRRLALAGAGGVSWEELLHLLRQSDRSFAPLPGEECRAANRGGFQVQLVKTGVRRTGRQKTVTVPGALAPLPPEAGNLQYLLTSPKLSQVVIGQDGYPATMVAADPRAFALNRFWLSQQEDREGATRQRDFLLARAVARLVLSYLPQYDFFSTELDMLPQDLVQSAARITEGAEQAAEEFWEID